MLLLAGTFAVTQGSTAVTATNSALVNQVFEGDVIAFTTGGAGSQVSIDKLYRVNVDAASDTALTLATAYAEATASGLIGWLLPLSIKRQNTLAVSAQMTDFVARYGELLTAKGADRRVTLRKTAAGDYAEVLFGQGASDLFKMGLPADNEFHLQAKINSGVWTDVFRTVTAGASPSQTVSVVFGQAITFAAAAMALPIYDSAAFAAGKGGKLKLDAQNASGNQTTYAQLAGYSTTMTAGAEVGDFVVSTMRAGTLTEALRVLGAGNILVGTRGLVDAPAYAFGVDPDTGMWSPTANTLAWSLGGVEELRLTAAALSPGSSDGAALGTTAAMWADLFLASGGVINFNNGDVTITHAVNLLTIAGGDLSLSSTTASTSTTTGALTVAGGVGIGGALIAGGNVGIGTDSLSAFLGSVKLVVGSAATTATSAGMTVYSGTAAIGYMAFADGLTGDAQYRGLFEYNHSLDRMLIYAGGVGRVNITVGVQIGIPTGGDKGDGTLNAVAVYDDNVLLTCFGVEYLLDGKIDVKKWDGYAPSGVNPLVHRFAAMVAEFDPRDPDQYLSRMRADRALPGMPTERDWEHNALSLGVIHNHLWLSTELLAAAFVGHVSKTEARLAALESRPH